MKNLKKYIYGALAVALSAVLPSCQDHFDEPSMEDVPVASNTPNTKISQLKEWLWSDSNNYCDQIYTVEWYNTPEAERTEEMKTQGTHVIISGRVVSSDYAGNCFKYIVLQDETGAINFSINSYNLYLNYRRGQEIVVDLTGLHAGKYRGLEQVGFPSYNSSLPGYETSFMAPEMFARNAELNGRPDHAKVDTINIDNIASLGVTPAELRKWQSQLVRFNNVEFVPNTTTPTLSTYHSSGVTQQIRDAAGNTIDIRTSGYANFWNMTLPTERCDVVAILGYYVSLAGTGGWQLTLLDANSIMNVGDPTVPLGSESKPYSVLQAIALQVNGPETTAWVRGYIVGTVAPEIEEVTSSNDIEWGAEATLRNTLVIGQTPETRDIAECIVLPLPQGTALQNQAALRENPDNLGKQIDIRGTFATFMNTYGLTGNNGSASGFHIEGKGPVGPVEGDGTEENPYTCDQVIALGNPGSTAWVSGYIVGVINYDNNSSLETTVPTTVASCVAIASSPDVTDKNKCVAVQLPVGNIRTAVNLKDNPGNLGKEIVFQGSLETYFGIAGIKNTTAYKMDGGGDTPGPDQPGTPEGDGTPANPYNATAAIAVAKALSSDGKQEAYVKGKVSEIKEIDTGDFGNATYSITDGSSTLLIYRGYYLNGDKFTSADQLKVGDEVVVTGDLINYMGNTPEMAQRNKLVSINGQGGSVTPPGPTPDTFKGNFSTFNDGTPKSTYGTYTNSTGWQAVNCNILGGQAAGVADQNPRFAFIGSESTLAVCLNGKTSATGVLTSPELTGGIKTLTFKYGLPYSDKACSFTVEILQNGAVVKSETVTPASPAQKTAYDFSMPVNIEGSFVIRITNNSPSAADSNKDRVAVWDLTWD